jgi:MFS family permease
MTQGLILGSFYIGYILTQLPGGMLAGKYGGKQLLGWCMLLCAVATIITPFAARANVILLIAVRGFAGLCQVKHLIAYYKSSFTMSIFGTLIIYESKILS